MYKTQSDFQIHVFEDKYYNTKVLFITNEYFGEIEERKCEK